MKSSEDTPAAALIEATGLGFTYGALQAVRGVDLSLRPGVTALLGPNGAGKSTLLRMLATVTRPSHGSFRFRGTPVLRGSVGDYRRHLGYLPQKPSWHGWMTVQETVSYFAWLRKIRPQQASERVGETIEKVGLTPWADERLSRLSGGMLQRALLATAVVHRPPLLILDEPSAGLDPSQRVGLRTILRELNPGGAVLLSTHILEDVAALADDALIMKEGSIKFAGPVRGITETSAQGSLSHVSELESAYLEIVGQ